MVNTGFFVFMQFFIKNNTISWTAIDSKFFLDKSEQFHGVVESWN